MSREYLGERLAVFIGDSRCEDEPRGRELTISAELGIPTAEFDPPRYLYGMPTMVWGGGPGPNIGRQRNPDYREYGSWAIVITLWYWSFRIAVRGPVLGSWPSDEDDTLVFDEAERLR